MKKLSPLWWIAVALYTLSLPSAIIAYEAVTLRWSAEIAGLIPRFILVVVAVAYLFSATSLRKKIILIPCCIIALAVVFFESNPNKHIHIPEYILMTWLVFGALSRDYRGGGILVLVFVLSSLLGIFDEVLQGLHPGRSYGWQDMITNTASSLIGVLTIFGLRRGGEGGWDWTDHLGKKWQTLTLLMSGMVLTAISCHMLFRVTVHNGSWDSYPVWLIVMNIVLIMAGSIAIWVIFQRNGLAKGHTTATLWLVSPLAIILIIDMVIVMSWGARLPFR